MKLPWQAAAKSTTDSAGPAESAADLDVRPSDLDAALAILRAEAVVGLTEYAYLRSPAADPHRKADFVRELMAGFGLTPDSFRTPDGRPTRESFLFAAARRAGDSLEGWELDLNRFGLRKSNLAEFREFDGTLSELVDEARGEHRYRFGRELKVKDPAAFLETRLAAYAELREVDRALRTSRIGAHPEVVDRWAEQVGRIERRLGEALDARRVQQDRLDHSRAESGLTLPALLTGFEGGLAGIAAAAGKPRAGIVPALAALLAGSYVGSVLRERADIAAKARAVNREARGHHAELHRLLLEGPSARHGRLRR